MSFVKRFNALVFLLLMLLVVFLEFNSFEGLTESYREPVNQIAYLSVILENYSSPSFLSSCVSTNNSREKD